MIGAAVFVVGNTSTGVMTDVDANYTLTVPSNSSIAVSCIGYSTQTITVGSESVYNVVLQEDTQLLEETVVIGYGVQKKSYLTGSVASVGADDLKNQSLTDAASAAIYGAQAGNGVVLITTKMGSAAFRVK